MIERRDHERLDAVARTYLDREGPAPRLVVVAGEDPRSTQETVRCLQRAATGIGLPTVLLSGNSEVVDLELAHDRTAPLIVYHHGAVSEQQLSRLRPPQDGGVDLLLWDHPQRSKIGLRTLYLLGLWSWALRPWQARCLVPPAVGEDPPLRELRTRLRVGLEALDTEGPFEVLERPGAYHSEACTTLLGQVLQALLASSTRRRVVNRHEPPPRGGLEARVRSSVAALAFLCVVSLDVMSALATPTTVEVRGVDLAAPTAIAHDGSQVFTGPFYFLRVQPGVGTLLEDGGVLVSTERTQLHATLDDVDLAFDDSEHRIEKALVLHAAEFSAEVRRGSVRAGPDGIVIEPQMSGPQLPGRQGLLITGVMLVMILLMVWRASSVRRKLDQPYVSVRRRKRDLEG